MRNARHQYDVIVSIVGHLIRQIDKNATPEERARFKEVYVPFLDTLADLLNTPRIAQAWEEELPADGSVLIDVLNANKKG